MQARELTVGRTFAVTFEHGEDFFSALAAFCDQHDIAQGYLPMFIAGFAEADVVGTCDALDDPKAPVWTKVHLRNVEALGAGTLARAPRSGALLPHIHASLGLKEHSATAHTSHLLAATVQFLVELVVVEVTAPTFTRVKDPGLYDVPLLKFGP
jgi:predicted DNA-binding protein with PD1-like motif